MNSNSKKVLCSVKTLNEKKTKYDICIFSKKRIKFISGMVHVMINIAVKIENK